MQKYGRLTIKEKLDTVPITCICLCDCGNVKTVILGNLKTGNSKSCGCLWKEINTLANKKAHTTHGMTGSPEHKAWLSMKSRSKSKKGCYKDVTLSDEWENDFYSFFLSMGVRPSKNHSIDRINPYKGYSKENCRWATSLTQNCNKRKLMSRNKSGFRGVHWHKTSSKWIAQIMVNYKRTCLGGFESAVSAAKAYDLFITSNNLSHTQNFKGS